MKHTRSFKQVFAGKYWIKESQIKTNMGSREKELSKKERTEKRNTGTIHTQKEFKLNT